MKVQDVCIGKRTVIEKGKFVPILVRNLNQYNLEDCYIVMVSSTKDGTPRKTLAYRGNKLPPFEKWYQFPELPLFLRIASFFSARKDEVFVVKELFSVLSDVNYSSIRATLSGYFKNRIVLSRSKIYYGCRESLELLARQLTKNGISFKRVKDESITFIVRVRFRGKETCLEYTY